jgi:hypothetical protein
MVGITGSPCRVSAGVFGDQSPYGTLLSLKDAIYALKATPSQAGVCDSVTAYVKFNFDSCKVRCALYTRSGNDTVLVANAVTVERRFAGNPNFAWQGFAFAAPKPIVHAGVEYFIAIFGDTAGAAGGGLARLAGQSSGGVLLNKPTDYESGFPSKSNPSGVVLNFRASVYCTYSVESPAIRRRHIAHPHQP